MNLHYEDLSGFRFNTFNALVDFLGSRTPHSIVFEVKTSATGDCIARQMSETELTCIYNQVAGETA